MSKGMIFDMDGLIIDSEPYWEEAKINIFKSYDCYLDKKICSQTTGLKMLDGLKLWRDNGVLKSQDSDFIIADRGYSRAPGIEYIAKHNAFLCVRVNTSALPLLDVDGKKFPLMSRLKQTKVASKVAYFSVLVPTQSGNVKGRLCALRKSEESIRLAHKKLRRKASQNGRKLKKETLFFAQYVIVFTTFPECRFSAKEVLEWYRIRWQIELVFKRFKQIAHLGHLPKYDDDSAKAWLYGKLLTALLTEKIVAHAATISPWGYSISASQ